MTEHENNNDPQFFMVEFHKQWHKRGFLSARYWPWAEKVQIEIAQIDPNSNKALSVSKCFIDTFKFMSYLHAEVHNNLHMMYPEFETDEWKDFGGRADSSGSNISRVFTAGYWRAKQSDSPDKSKRGFRCGNYQGRIGNNGSVMPDYDNPISFDLIQMKMRDIGQMYHSLTTIVNAYAIQKADQTVVFDD